MDIELQVLLDSVLQGQTIPTFEVVNRLMQGIFPNMGVTTLTIVTALGNIAELAPGYSQETDQAYLKACNQLDARAKTENYDWSLMSPILGRSGQMAIAFLNGVAVVRVAEGANVQLCIEALKQHFTR